MKAFHILLVTLASTITFGQSGGLNTLDFLQLVQPARVSALGGVNLSIFDGDANMAGLNPGLLNGRMHGEELYFENKILIEKNLWEKLIWKISFW